MVLLLLALLFLLAAAAGTTWAMRRRCVTFVPADERPDVLAVHRHLSRWRLGGLAAAVAVTVGLLANLRPLGAAWGPAGDVGRTLALVPAIAALSLVLATIVGERTAPRPGSAVRTATVEPRRIADIVPERLATLVGAGLFVLALLLLAGSLMGSADDLGRAGRVLAVRCSLAGSGSVGALVSSSAGPWPGSFYTVPIALAMLVVVACALASLLSIVRRPRPGATSAVLDTVLRRDAGRNVVLSLGLFVFATLSPVAALMAGAMARNQCSPSWWALPACLLGALTVAGVALGTFCALSLLVTPVLRVRDDRPARHAARREGRGG